ncbi:MAG: glycosyltransferase family 2 protein [Alphaproteobacteria bacterium]
MTEHDDVSITIVIPVYCEADSLGEIVDRIEAVFAAIGRSGDYQVLFINDGSTDHTLDVLKRLSETRPWVRSVNFRRNFGKSLALMAGFLRVRSPYVITMDGDLQDSPEDIPLILSRLEEGYDLVNGWRTQRKDQRVRRWGSRLFNTVVARTTGLQLHDVNCGFKAYRAPVLASLCLYGQYHRYIPLQAHLAGFRVGEVPISNSPRAHGVSKFKTFRYQGAFDLLSLLFTYRYGLNPLYFFGITGVAIMIPCIAVLLFLIGEQSLYWLGFGAEYKVIARPVLLFALVMFMLGGSVFLTGFVCDFILHHQIRSRIDSIVDLGIASITERGETRSTTLRSPPDVG